jgi:MFS family permease
MASETPAKVPGIGPDRYRWELVFLLWGAFFLNQADRQVFNVVLPLIREDLGLSDQALGLIATTFTLVYGLLVPFAGIAGDLIDRRRVVFLSLLVFSTGTLLTGFASGFLLLLLFRGVATGAGEAFYAPAASSLIGSVHTETRARALSLHQTANYTGIVLGGLLSGWVGQSFGWRAAFVLYGVMGLAWSVVFYRRSRRYVMPATPRRSSADQRALFGEAIRLVVTTPALIGQMLAFGGLVFTLVGFLTWSPTLLYERFGLTLADAGFSSVFYHHLAAYAGLLVASWFTDRLIPRIPRIRLLVMAFGLFASAPFIWWAAGAQSLVEIYVALAAFGLFRGMYDAGIFAAIFDVVEDRLRATVTGVILASGFLIGAMSPLIMGTMKAEYGLEGGMQVLAVASALAGAILLIATMIRPLRPRA